MGCRIISDENGAIFYCSTTMKAFGLVMVDEGEAEDFMMWLVKDPRIFTEKELEDKYKQDVLLITHHSLHVFGDF